MGQRRYPGATPFRGDQAKIFYGRDRDIEKMLTLIQVEKKVLLYSKSGLGKTSLLEAGIIPKLPAKFTPISIRFYASSSESVSLTIMRRRPILNYRIDSPFLKFCGQQKN